MADKYAVFSKLLVLGASVLGVTVSLDYNEHENLRRFEFPVLMLYSTVGMMIMVSASNLMTLYMGLELQSLALYVVAALRREDPKATEAGLKYFVLGALSSGMLLYGASLVYGFTGMTQLDQAGPQATGLRIGCCHGITAAPAHPSFVQQQPVGVPWASRFLLERLHQARRLGKLTDLLQPVKQ